MFLPFVSSNNEEFADILRSKYAATKAAFDQYVQENRTRKLTTVLGFIKPELPPRPSRGANQRRSSRRSQYDDDDDIVGLNDDDDDDDIIDMAGLNDDEDDIDIDMAGLNEDDDDDDHIVNNDIDIVGLSDDDVVAHDNNLE